MFVDRAKIWVKSGKGGDGAVSFRREPYVPEGGPDGGDGGNGGSIIFRADRNLRTLMDFRYKRKYEAEAGQNGMKRKKFGKKGQDLIIRVPEGTVVLDENTGLAMGDLKKDGDELMVAKGGKGGKGNVHFKNSIRQAPNFAEAGGFAQERNIILELKSIADVGLVGFPNVGKSSLLAATTKANPKIENYHFTTIDPNLGVVELFDKSFVMADIAGIIEGAHKGIGLGFRFLKHIERTKVLIHVIDVSGTEGRDPIEDFIKINDELKQYGHGVAKKHQIVCANKIDLLGEDNDNLQRLKAFLESRDIKLFPVSAATGEGIKPLLQEALYQLEHLPEIEDELEYFNFEEEALYPEYRVVEAFKDGDEYCLQGKQLRKIFNSTNFNDMGSLRYLYKYIEQSGAMDKLIELGLKEGDTIKLFDYEFEYYED